MPVINRVAALKDEITEWRRDLHAHPEILYEVHRTAGVVADKLKAFGCDEVVPGIGRTGVVGVIKGRGTGSGKVIGLRADMDALPMREMTGLPYASRTDGAMHACGHDGHTAMLLGAAKYLCETRNFDGTAVVIFQPAEEGGAGAQRMIDDGLFEKCPCDAVFGMHNWPGAPVGTIGMRAGPMMASSNEFEIRIDGRGGHAALPHLTVDPVLVACQLVQALQGILTRNKKPIDTAVLSVTQIHTGEAVNVIPDHAVISGTVRTFTIEVLDLVERRMREIVAQLPPAFGAEGRIDFHRNYPPLINHERETAFARRVAGEVVGEQNVYEFEPTMGSEDFAYMLLARPGCYVGIGNGDGGHRESGHGLGPCTLHNPSYDFNDELIPIGASYWVRLAEAYLSQEA